MLKSSALAVVGQELSLAHFPKSSSEWPQHPGTCRTANSYSSANPDLDPTEDTGGLVPVTSLLVGDQDKRLLSEAANASTRPADLIEIARDEGTPYFLLKGYNVTCQRPTAALASDKLYDWTWDNLKLLIAGNR